MSHGGPTEPPAPIAIIGMAAMLPGSATIREFFVNVLRGRCFIHPIPAEMWEQELFYSDERRAPFTTYCRIGGVLDRRPDDLDMTGFRIPPTVARQMSGNQKAALICARDAIRDAQLDTRPFDRSRTGVVVAAVSGDRYESAMESIVSRRVRHRLEGLDLSPDERQAVEAALARYDERYPLWPITEDTLPGASANLVAGRIASAFDLCGFNETIDSACASSLAAVARGVAALRLGQCDLVVAGGVDTDMSANSFVQFARIGALSAEGSFPFDARADGFVMGQGCGMVVLRRLEEAVSAGDRILAVIRGVGASSDGAGKGITAASSAGQLLALERAYADACIDPSTITFIECHGTGTVAGDAAELASLAMLKRSSGRRTDLPIGSAKAMVGHLKVAAGMAGLFRAILAINARVVPPQVNFEMPTSSFDWASAGLRVPRRLEPLDASEIRVGVSAFGFGGTNHHVVLSTPPDAAREPIVDGGQFTLPYLPQQDSDVAFVFPGQGVQYAGMLSSVRDEPIVRDLCQRAEAVVAAHMTGSLESLLFAQADDECAQAALRGTAIAQPLIFVASAAFLELIRDRGVACGVAFGHSLGEYTALYASGMLSFEEALSAVAHRGRLMAECPDGDRGGMAVLRCGVETTQNLIAAAGAAVVCANINSYDQTVVSGATAAVSSVVQAAHVAGISAAPMSADRGFHSPLLAGCVSPLRAVLESLRPRASAIPVLANRSRRLYPWDAGAGRGRPLTTQESTDFVDLLAEQAVRPVDFVGQVETGYAAGIRRFVEVGPRRVLTGLISEILAGRPHQAIAVDEGGHAAMVAERLPALLAEALRIPRPAARVRSASGMSADPVRTASSPLPPPPAGPRDRVLAVVAAVTGYKAQDLADDAEFERDLGIDTLKIFEIISRLIGDVLPSGFSRLRDATSVRKILTLAAADSDPIREYQPTATDDPPVRAFRIETAIDDVQPVAQKATRRFVVSPRLVDANVDLSAVRALHDPSASDVVLLWPLPESSRDLCDHVLPELMAAVRAEADVARGQPERPEVTVVTLGTTPDPGVDCHRAVAAAVKSFQKDLRDLRFAHWHIDSIRPDIRCLATVISNPLLGPRLRGDVSVERERLVPIDLAGAGAEALATLLGPDDTILVTGGARGIAAVVVRHLLTVVSSRFLLVGRRPERQSWMDSAGPGRVECLVADVGDHAAVERLGLKARGVTLILHAAGVVRSRPLAQLEQNDMESLMRPKISGLNNVVLAADSDRLRGIVCFSSLASTLGGDGHPDYAVANACLDGFRHPRVPVLSIGWSAWDGAGMATDARTRRFLDLSGVALIPEQRAVAAFDSLVAGFLSSSTPRTEAVVVHAGLQRGCILERDVCGWDLLDDTSPHQSPQETAIDALLIRQLRPRALEPLTGPGDIGAVMDAVLEPPATLAIAGVAVLALSLDPVADFALVRGPAIFTAFEMAELEACGTDRRRRHKAAGKLAAKLLTCEIARRRHGVTLAVAEVEVRSTAGPAHVEIHREGLAVCRGLRFSISHCDGVVCAAAADHSVGIDVEEVRSLDPATAGRIMGESAAGTNADPLAAIAVFTRKEAVLKAIGVGIGGGLEDVTIEAAADIGRASARYRARRFAVATDVVGSRVISVAVADPASAEDDSRFGAPPQLTRRRMPISPVQESLWLVERFGMAGTALAFGWTERFVNGVDIGQLRTALEHLVARHEPLRSTFHEESGRCVAEVAPHVAVDLAVEDVASVEAVLQRCTIEARERFDLSEGPLFRFLLLRISPHEDVLLLLFHHLVMDVSSALVFRHELHALLAAIAAGRVPQLKPLPIAFYDHATRHRDALTPDRVASMASFWRKALGGTDHEPLLLTDFRRTGGSPRRVAEVLFEIPQSVVALLDTGARHAGVTLFTVFLSAFATLLSRLSGREDVVVGTPFAGRTQPEIHPLVGCFVTMLPLRLRISADTTFAELLPRARDVVLDAIAHHELPFERIVEAVNPQRLSGTTPLFQAVIRFLHDVDGPAEGPVSEFIELPAVGTLYDISLVVHVGRDGARCRFEYDPDLFREATIARIGRQLVGVLETVAAGSTRPVSAMLLSRPQAAAVVPGGFPMIGDAFADSATRHPDAIALVEGDRTVSYGELAGRAARLANHLRARGVAGGQVVGVCMRRSIDMVVTWLAVLDAGGAYMPIDSDYPPDRVRQMLEDSAAAYVVTNGVPCPGLPPMITRVDLVSDAEVIARESDMRPANSGDIESAAYVMFTSGSTGRPKGVVVPHRGVTSLARAMAGLPLDESVTALHHSPVTFDASTFEVWCVLLNGARCVIASERLPSVSTFRDLIGGQRVNVLWLTSSLFNVLVDEAPDILRPIHTLLVGGEPLSVPHVCRGLAKLPGTTIINGYGPTECTTFSTLHRVPRNLDERAQSIPIGSPLKATVVRLVDSQGRPVPEGAMGEIYVGGAGVAIGYAGDPQATAERFVVDSEGAAGRVYRTGDLGRLLPDGTIEFLGRNDDQVKVRGYRIEPGEVEAALLSHRGVGRAGCVAVGGAADRRLVAHVVPADPATVRSQTALSSLVAELGRLLAATLPKHVIPHTLVISDRLPLSANGKVDRRALAAALPAMLVPQRRSPRPAHPTEALVAAVWESLLNVERVGATDDFFALGGTSLTAVVMAARIEVLLGRRVPLVSLFNEATVASVSRAILGADHADDPPLLELQPRGGAVPLVFLHGDFLGGGLYCRQLATAIGPDQPLIVLQPHGLAGQPVQKSVQEMAAAHVDLLRRAVPGGPYRLAGYCNGALEVFEMARLLSEAGGAVEFIGLIAPPNVPRSAPSGGASTQEGDAPTVTVPPSRWDALRACGLACASYRPTLLNQRVTIIQPADDVVGQADAACGWRAFAKHVDLHVIPGGHETMVARHAAELGRVLADCLQRLDGRQEAVVTAPGNAAAVDHRANAFDSRDARSLFRLGTSLKNQRRFREAARAYRRCLRIAPANAAAAYNLGNAIKDQGHRRLAAVAYRRAVAIDPSHADGWMNLGNSLRFQGRLDEAVACFDRVLAIRPDDAQARWNRALVLLARGEWLRGWDDFEFRSTPDQHGHRHGELPPWDGRPLDSGSVLLRTEQGLGDTLQFVRYAPLVQRLVGRVVLECQRPLVPLLGMVAGIDAIVARGDAVPQCDREISLMSLPRIFGTTPDTVPSDVPYLAARADLIEVWRPWVGKAPGVRVGIAWAGNPSYPEDRDRSPGLAAFTPLADLVGASFVALQKEAGDPAWSPHSPLSLWRPPGPIDETTGAFMDTAAIVSQLDLVITSDTAVAHLAGALGVETWVVLPDVADWRWLLDRDDSPWYPRMRLFRQERSRDWYGVFTRVRVALELVIGQRRLKGNEEGR